MRRLASPWAVILAGPVLGMTYFWVVYLLAEATCAPELELISTGALRTVILATTAATVAVLAGYALRARWLWSSDGGRHVGSGDVGSGSGADDRRQNRRFLLVTGLMLLAMFALFALFLAAPVVGSSLCTAPL
ncbi:MAG: hypothetical protein ACRDZ2_10355 [Ilumatobacteraceae bacterium]